MTVRAVQLITHTLRLTWVQRGHSKSGTMSVGRECHCRNGGVDRPLSSGPEAVSCSAVKGEKSMGQIATEWGSRTNHCALGSGRKSFGGRREGLLSEGRHELSQFAAGESGPSRGAPTLNVVAVCDECEEENDSHGWWRLTLRGRPAFLPSRQGGRLTKSAKTGLQAGARFFEYAKHCRALLRARHLFRRAQVQRPRSTAWTTVLYLGRQRGEAETQVTGLKSRGERCC